MKHNKDYLLSRITIDPLTRCWIWNLAKDKDGYGECTLFLNGVHIRTKGHRLAFEIWNPTTFNPNLCVLHRCDNPPCCNPKHLFQGTPKDNWDDMISKGRQVTSKGESNGMSELTEREVLEIRAKYIPWIYSQNQLAHEYGVSNTLIFKIIHRILWTHI